MCRNPIRETCKMEAMQLAQKLQHQPAKEISWADLWKFITAVHCVHHFDEAVKFELPYSLEILARVLREQEGLDEQQRRFEEWEAVLREGEEREEVRRHARLCGGGAGVVEKRRRTEEWRLY